MNIRVMCILIHRMSSLYMWKHEFALSVNVVLLGVSNHFLLVIHILNLYV